MKYLFLFLVGCCGVIFNIATTAGGSNNKTESQIDCGGKFVMSQAFDSTEAQDILSSFSMWNIVAGKKILSVKSGDSEYCSINRVDDFNYDSITEKYGLTNDKNKKWMGYFDRKTNTIWIYTNTNSISRIAAHELGHYLGLTHVKNGIMMAVSSEEEFSKIHFSKEDLTECKRVNVCN